MKPDAREILQNIAAASNLGESDAEDSENTPTPQQLHHQKNDINTSAAPCYDIGNSNDHQYAYYGSL